MSIYLNEGDVIHIKGSGKNPYEIKKSGGVVSCSCPAWRNLGGPIDVRVCKHIKANIDPKCLLPQAQAVKEFWYQSVVNRYAKILVAKNDHVWDDPIRTFGFIEEVYVQKYRNCALTTFAILKDGQWIENSEMGWFGITHDEKMSDEQWRGILLCCMIDCHQIPC